MAFADAGASRSTETGPVNASAKAMPRRRLRRTSPIVAAALTAFAALLALTPAVSGATTTPRWRALPKAPIPGRYAASAVWTGKEMVVWGGRVPGKEAATVGAAYDPATRKWRRIAAAPAGIRGDGPVAIAWTGREMLVWATSAAGVGGPVGTAAYNPVSDTWRRLPAGPLGRREGFVSVWTGKELIVIGGAAGDRRATPVAAALSLRTGRWRVLHAFDGRNLYAIPSGAVWNGQRVIFGGALCAGATTAPCSPFLTRLDPATDTLRDINLKTANFERDTLVPLLWTGKDVVFEISGSAVGIHAARAIAFARYTPVWRLGTPGPCTVSEDFTQTAVLGRRFAAACGAIGLQLYDFGSEQWRLIAPGPSPFNSLGGSAIAWTGRELIVWGGAEFKRSAPALDSGASLVLGP